MQVDSSFKEISLINQIKDLLDACLFECAKQFDKILIVRDINPYALYRMYYGAIGKSYKIINKTEKNGPIAGLIYSDCPKLSKPAPFISDDNNHSILVPALIDSYGRFITSDLDMVIVLSKNNLSKTFFDKTMGYINQEEKKIILFVNDIFRQKLNKLNPSEDYTHLNIIMHGSFNIFPKSKQSFVTFPLIGYAPDNIKIQLNSIHELSLYLDNCKNQNFKLTLNKNWNI